MKVFDVEKIRAWDAYTIENEPIAPHELMNRAAEAFANWFEKIYSEPDQAVAIFCGTGNNGGDGLAVAQLLHQRFFEVKVFVCDFGGQCSADVLRQLGALPPRKAVPIRWLKTAVDLPQLLENEVVVDAIFGSGLSRPLAGEFEKLVLKLNALPNERVAIDLPSGLFADRHTPGVSILASRTFSFEQPKRAFFFPENFGRVGEWTVGSIGLHPDFQQLTPTQFHFLEKSEAAQLVRPRRKFDHKGTFGHALLVAGSLGKMGAAVLATRACLRSGAGLLTVRVPRCGLDVLQIACPEAMCLPDEEAAFLSQVPDLQSFTAVGIGPGLGQNLETERMLGQLLRLYADFAKSAHLVLDADALNLLANNPDWWRFVPKNSLLTPHPKEFERLFGKAENDFARNDLQREMAEKHGIFLILKGANTAIACPDGSCYFNSTGNPGMATGGSGDVLTGILTGLLAQGYEPRSVALLGVFLHGLAGDWAAERLGFQALVAGDLVENIGRAYRDLALPSK